MLSSLFATAFLVLSAGLIPPGFYVFCADHPAECQPVEPAKPLKMADWRDTLERVNRQVNREITYKIETIDAWTLSPEEGDCDDYTVTKRQRLIEAGVPRGTMRAAYVLLINDISHVFLVVSTDEGPLVLDNYSGDEIRPLNNFKLKRLSLQDAVYPHLWWQIW